MWKDLQVLVVIPARGGSKGIPHKNIVPIEGKPLVHYTIEFLRELPWIDHSVISTDSETVATVARQADSIDVVWRPAELAGDRIGDMPVLRHALASCETELGTRFDAVVMLQPTSPLRTTAEVEKCLDLLTHGEWDSVWTLSPTDLSYHPDKQLSVSASGHVAFWSKHGINVSARQQLTQTYHRNGVAYAFRAEFVRTADSIYSAGRSTAIVTSGHHTSIDTHADLEAVASAIRERKVH